MKIIQKQILIYQQSYSSSSGNILPCRNKCKDKIIPEQQEGVSKLYWQLGSFKLRQAFVAELFKIYSTKIVEGDKIKINPRKGIKTYKYCMEINDQAVLVCQKCFKATFSEIDRFLKTVAEKKNLRIWCFSQSTSKTPNTKKISASNEIEVIELISYYPLYISIALYST